MSTKTALKLSDLASHPVAREVFATTEREQRDNAAKMALAEQIGGGIGNFFRLAVQDHYFTQAERRTKIQTVTKARKVQSLAAYRLLQARKAKKGGAKAALAEMAEASKILHSVAF